MKKIENLKEALEEAKTRKTIEEEEDERKKKVHAAAEEGRAARAGPEYGAEKRKEAQR